MILNEYGQIAYDEWIKLTERFTNFEMDVFQIMPNHMHGIILLNDVSASVFGATARVAPTFAPNNVVPNTVAPNTVTQNTVAPNTDAPNCCKSCAKLAP